MKPKFHRNRPLSNWDPIEWAKYLNVPIRDVFLPRDVQVTHNHQQALFIYNLEPCYMSGSHWVATYVQDCVINYFDSFGMPPFQELVDYARQENLTLLHQDDQIQNLWSMTCLYYLYFLNEMYQGQSYLTLMQPFTVHVAIKNEKLKKTFLKKFSFIYLSRLGCDVWNVAE